MDLIATGISTCIYTGAKGHVCSVKGECDRFRYFPGVGKSGSASQRLAVTHVKQEQWCRYNTYGGGNPGACE